MSDSNNQSNTITNQSDANSSTDKLAIAGLAAVFLGIVLIILGRSLEIVKLLGSKTSAFLPLTKMTEYHEVFKVISMLGLISIIIGIIIFYIIKKKKQKN